MMSIYAECYQCKATTLVKNFSGTTLSFPWKMPLIKCRECTMYCSAFQVVYTKEEEHGTTVTGPIDRTGPVH